MIKKSKFIVLAGGITGKTMTITAPIGRAKSKSLNKDSPTA